MPKFYVMQLIEENKQDAFFLRGMHPPLHFKYWLWYNKLTIFYVQDDILITRILAHYNVQPVAHRLITTITPLLVLEHYVK